MTFSVDHERKSVNLKIEPEKNHNERLETLFIFAKMKRKRKINLELNPWNCELWILNDDIYLCQFKHTHTHPASWLLIEGRWNKNKTMKIKLIKDKKYFVVSVYWFTFAAIKFASR